MFDCAKLSPGPSLKDRILINKKILNLDVFYSPCVLYFEPVMSQKNLRKYITMEHSSGYYFSQVDLIQFLACLLLTLKVSDKIR